MRAREFVREDADGQQVLDYIHGTHHEPLTKQLQQAVLSYPRWELRSVPVSSLHIPDQEYDDEEQEPEADPYNRVQAIDPDHAGEYSANFVDRRPIVVDSEGWIIDGNHRAWAAAELLNRSTIRAWVPASQLNELGNAPADYKPNRKRSRSLFHATVDGQWVDVFFDRSEFNGTLHITFAVNGDYDAPEQPTSASKSTVKILSTVLNIVKKQLPEYMAKARPPAISFTSKQDNRTSLYRKYFVPVIQNILGAKWQHEEYPSMGMTVFHWKPVKKSGVTEAFDQPYAIQWTKQNGDWHATADLDDGSELIVLFMSQGDNQWMVEFERDENMEITGEGDAQRVFATVLTAMRQFIAKRKPAMLNFSAEKEDDPRGSRARLYDRMIQRYITGTGYDLTREDMPGGATYTLTKQVQGVAESENNDTAISLSKLGKFHPVADTLAEFVPERATAQYALHPDKWESTFYSLTNKDSEKLKYYGPKKISIPPGTLVGDMAIANKFYRAKTPEEKQQYAELYKASLQPYPVDVSAYRMPELLIPRQGVAENFADGRNPGRKGLAKRSGVNTKASVSSLRKTAKNSSGEKQRMAHWLANMKAGRAKAKKK
jgi:hypothetical protein